MIPEELQTLRTYRMEQSRAALEDAEFLLLHNRAALSIVNRACYAMFYAALALLQDISPIPSKHAGIISLFDANLSVPKSSTKNAPKTSTEHLICGKHLITKLLHLSPQNKHKKSHNAHAHSLKPLNDF